MFVQETLTSTCWGLAFSSFARCTVSTPSLNSALTFAGLASSGSEKLRPKAAVGAFDAVILLAFLLLLEFAFAHDGQRAFLLP